MSDELGNDFAASLGLLGGGNPTDGTGLVPLTGPNVARPHNPARVRLESIVGSRRVEAVVAYALKSYRACREIVHFMTVTELVQAYKLEHAGLCRKSILMELARHIFDKSKAALLYKLRQIKSK